MSTIYLNHLGLLCALGNSPAEVAAALQAGESPGMQIRKATSPGVR